MITRQFKQDDRGAWNEEADSSCCCTDRCHEAHLEQSRAELAKLKDAMDEGRHK